MPQQVEIPGVGTVEFPDEMSPADINTAAKRLHDGAQSSTDSSVLSPGLLLQGVRASVPAVQRTIEEVATHPAVTDAGQGLGKLLGGIVGLKGGYLGMKTGETVGSATGRGAAALAQRGAGSAVPLLERLAPYAQTLSTASGAQSLLDLAQMAEPNRRDIGVLGVGSDVARSDADKAAHPALLNMLLQKLLGQ